MRRALLVLFATLVPVAAIAQDIPSNPELQFAPGAQDLPIRFENITLEDGLSQSTVYSILQDRKGFMWFGTQVGLNRYDGHHIEQFLPDPFDSTSIHDSYIWNIVEDSTGMLWLTYEDGTVSRFDPSTGHARNFYSSDTDTTRIRPGRNIAFLIDSKGRTWTGGPGGVQLIDTETGTVERYGTGDWNGGAIGWVGTILEESAGTLLVAGTNGIRRFDPENGTFEMLADIGTLSYLMVRDPRDPDVVWFGSFDGAHRLNVRTLERRRYDVTAGPNDGVVQARPDPSTEGVVWVSSSEGIARLDEETGAYRMYRAATSEVGGQAVQGQLLNNSIFTIYADRAGILWASAQGSGVSRFDPTAIGFGRDASNPDDPNSMRGQNVWSIAVAQDGAIWVAAQGSETSDPGWYLNRIDRRSGRVDYWKTNTILGSPLLVDRRGTVLFGTQPDDFAPFVGGVMRYDERRRTLVSQYSVANGMLPSDQIQLLEEGSDGAIWIGTNDGLVRIDPVTRARTAWLPDENDPAALHDGRIRGWVEDSRGDYWVGAWRDFVRISGRDGSVERLLDRDDVPEIARVSLARYGATDAAGRIWWVLEPRGAPSIVLGYLPEEDRFVQYEHDITDRTSWSGGNMTGLVPHPDDPDRVYFTTYGAGLSMLTPSTGSFRHYTVADGLTNQAAYEPIFDNEGLLWISTNSGLFEFDPETEQFRRFGLEYGLQSLEFNGGSVAKSPSGELFFGGVQGFNAFFPSQLRSNDVPPDVAITDFLLFNERVMPGPGSPLEKSISDTESIRLRYDQNAPTFRFAALHYKRPEANQIRYRLEPQDEEWVEAGDRTEASYTNLEPGDYTFQVIAANSDGVWNAQGASLKVIIEPPWWTRWWAYFIYAFGLATVVFGVDRYQRARISRKQREATRERELEHAKEIETAYNQLQQTKEQLVQQEKLASLGSLTAGIAHEIKNPLNFVNNFAEVNAELAQELEEAVARGNVEEARQIVADLRGNAEQITKHGKRADSIVRSMMQHARGETTERETVEVNNFVEEYVNLAWHGMRARDHSFSAQVQRDFDAAVGSVSVQPQEIGRVLLNLLNNAFHAVQEKAEFAGDGYSPEVRVSTRRSGSGIEIRVADNGPGIPTAIREKIFEPFFTTKATGEGTGLGLSLSHEIVTQGHGGGLTVEESESGGAAFVVRLPGA